LIQILPKNYLVNLAPIFLGQKIFCPKNILLWKMIFVRQNDFFGQKILGCAKMIFLSKNIFCAKIVFAPKLIFGSTKIFPPKLRSHFRTEPYHILQYWLPDCYKKCQKKCQSGNISVFSSVFGHIFCKKSHKNPKCNSAYIFVTSQIVAFCDFLSNFRTKYG